jgi:hypothetical protein
MLPPLWSKKRPSNRRGRHPGEEDSQIVRRRMSCRHLNSKSRQIAGRQSYTGPRKQNGGEENGGATIILERDDEGTPPGGALRV